MGPLESANLASKAVAQYCSDGTLPIVLQTPDKLLPVEGKQNTPVLVDGLSNTLGRRYVMEESCSRLRELGVDVICPSIEEQYNSSAEISAIYLVADIVNDEIREKCREAKEADVPVVVLCEAEDCIDRKCFDDPVFQITNDFTASLYLVGWAAMQTSS